MASGLSSLLRSKALLASVATAGAGAAGAWTYTSTADTNKAVGGGARAPSGLQRQDSRTIKRTYVMTSPRGILAVSTPRPTQCEAAQASSMQQGISLHQSIGGSNGTPRVALLEHLKGLWGETSTPRVWHARSPYASTHVFVGAAAHLLPKIKDVHAKDPQASLLLLTHPSSSSSSSSPEEYELQGMGVAVLVGTSVERVEPKTGLVLTKDERIIEFDSLTVSLPRSASSSSSSSKKGSVAEAIANPYDDEEEEEEEAAAATTRAPRRKPSWHETQVFFPERFFTPLPAPTKEQGKKQLWALSAMAPPPPSSSSSSSSASSFAATPCDGCSRIVKRKSLSGHGEGLHAIVTSSRLSRTDTWPWVWLARDQEGKGGPLHVVVADGKEALETAKARQQANKHATVVVVGKREGVPVAEFEGRGLAHVDGEVEELDATHAIILLDDARLIEADHIEFIHSSSSSS